MVTGSLVAGRQDGRCSVRESEENAFYCAASTSDRRCMRRRTLAEPVNPVRRSCLFADGIPHREGLGAGRDAIMSKAAQFSAFEPPEDLHVQFWFRETRY